MRVEELCKLTLDDLKWEEGLIRVKGKGGKIRFVPFPEPLQNVVRAYLKVRPRLKGVRALFISRKRVAVTKRCVQYLVERAARKAGLRHTTPHMLRHTFAVLGRRAGMKLEEIGEILGHESYETTKIYDYITLEELKEAMKRHPINALSARAAELVRRAEPKRFQSPRKKKARQLPKP